MLLLLLVVPVALALLAVSVLGLAGLGPLTDDRRDARDGVLGGVGPAIGLLGGVVLLAVAVLGSVAVIGLGGDEGDGEPSRERSVRAPSPRLAGPVEHAARTVTLDAEDGSTFPRSYAVVDRLPRRTVLSLHVRGFVPYARAIAEQCTTAVCGNAVPVQFDADGVARFQYLVARDVAAPVTRGDCGAGEPMCFVTVRSRAGGTVARIRTVFGDPVPPPGRISLRPASVPFDGDTVTVEVEDYPPHVVAHVMLCAAPDTRGRRCGAPGPETTLRVGTAGTGRARLHVVPGRVGAAGVPCARGDDCGISVVVASDVVSTPVVPITFAAPPGAGYDPNRLLIGLALAVLLIAIATWLLLRTDWSPIGEAAAPEIDDAEYADLDAIIAALPPEEEPLVPTG